MDVNVLMAVLGGAVMISMTALLYFALAPVMQARARVRRRIDMIQSKGGVHGVGVRTVAERSGRKKDIQSRLRQAEDAKKKEKSRAVKYRRDLKQAGLSITLKQFFLICAVVALLAAVVYLAMGYPPIGAVPVAISVGFGLPRFAVKWLGGRRVKKFTLLFANAVDVIVRGIRSGLPVGECLNIIARESPEPVAGVFREIVEAQRLGLSLEQALARAEELMPTSEMKFFNIVLGIQQQTGGNLAETLSNLSSILRARKKMGDKVKALSSEARSSAMIIGSLPFLMTGLLWLVSPEYISLLFTDDTGKVMIMAGLAWMGIGVFVMKQMVSFEI
jgi:tight adherence protein B